MSKVFLDSNLFIYQLEDLGPRGQRANFIFQRLFHRQDTILSGDFALREPLCMGSVGISTHEPWPPGMQQRRVYVFADRGWNRDGLQETVRSLQ